MTADESVKYRRRRARMSRAFAALCLAATSLCVLVLVILLVEVFWQGIPWLTTAFLTNYPSRFPDQAGIKPALVSSVWLIVLTALFSVPIGVGCAVYLEEYAGQAGGGTWCSSTLPTWPACLRSCTAFWAWGCLSARCN
jgi:ABC-type phosphate transport system permease subunit